MQSNNPLNDNNQGTQVKVDGNVEIFKKINDSSKVPSFMVENSKITNENFHDSESNMPKHKPIIYDSSILTFSFYFFFRELIIHLTYPFSINIYPIPHQTYLKSTFSVE